MLQLKSLEINGFKSFPDKTLIQFSSGVTAIVGPNGSGKSNISDAVRWVMGETSSKNLRGTKMEDVIFDGTKTRKALGFAQVALNLDNADGDLPIDFTEVSIARRYYRSGESEYFINGSNARLKDIQDLLRDTGLGKDGYSIIGQGTITEIITAKSSERRYLFEEAAGIAKYKYKKEESKKKLMMTQENILRLNDILAELGQRLPVLQKQSEKARTFLKLREEKKQLDIGLWLHAADTAQKEAQKAAETISALQRDISGAERELAQTEDAIDEESRQNQRLTEEIEALRGSARELEEQKSEKLNRVLLIQNDISHIQADIQRLETEKETLVKEDTGRREQKTKAQEAIQTLAEKLEGLEQEKKALETEKEDFAAAAGEFYRQSELLQHKIDENAALLNRAGTSLAVITQSRDTAQKRYELAKEELSAAEERHGTLQKNLAATEETIRELQGKIEENENIAKGHEIKYNLNKEKADKLDAECKNISQSVNEKSGRARMLADMEKNHEGFSGSVHLVVGDAQKGILQGIHGTVASIINVKQEYAVAIETALGAAIQNIVTENEAAAKNAIFYLKNKKAGRATFLPLSAIRGRTLAENTIHKTEGYIGIASQLIAYDEKYAQIIQFLLGRTVLVDTLDSGTELARKNGHSFKIVTSDGQVINPGGSLTGGSVAKSIGVLSRRNEITRLGEEVQKLQQQLREKSDALVSLRDETNRLSVLVGGLRDEHLALEKALIEQSGQKKHLEEYRITIERQITGTEREQKETQKLLDELQIQKTETEKAVQDYENELATNRGELDSLGKQHLSLREQQEQINAKIHEKTLEILTVTNERSAEMQTVANLEAAEAKNAETRQQRQAEIQRQSEKIEAFLSEIDALHEKAAEIDALLEKSGSEVQQKIQGRLEVEKEMTRLRGSEKEIYDRKEKLARETEKTEAGRKTAQENLEKLQVRFWDEYEIAFSDAKREYTVPADIREAEKAAAELKNQLRALGSVNVEAIDEYISVKNRYEELDGQVEDLVKAKEELEKIILSIEKEMTQIFKEKFGQICAAFERTFQELFEGGEAKLSLTDSDNVLESGIEIFVAPPGKIIKNMAALSGGEQSLTAIALYFAILSIHPAPFCLLDEIEAALDDVNVARYAEYLHRLAGQTQLITITHRRGTMEIADRLYGVTMREKGISKIITINVNEIEQMN